jgi:hypothetical protein
MSSSIRLILGATLGLFLVPVEGVAARAACGDIYPAMSLGPFPPEAQTTPPVFYAADDGPSGSFTVRFTGLACGQAVSVSAEYSDTSGSAVEGADYAMPPGRTPDVCETGCPKEQPVPFTIIDDGADPVAESFTVTLSNPLGGSLDPPSNAPFVLVDTDEPSRVAFDDLSYWQSETYQTLVVPVWLGGPASGATVPYTVGGDATLNEDYSVTSPNPLVFGVGDRVKLITLSIVNDAIGEADETVEMALKSPTGAALDSPSSKVVTILDNEEKVDPRSRFHHPRHTWKYRKSDYRILEFHVFAHDEADGSGVVAVELALRRNLENGGCAWKVKNGWQKKDCSNRTWLPTKYDDVGELFYYRMNQLKSSVGTKIKDYTAFSRAIDGAGNVEKDFVKKRNANTFEIKRTRKRRG